MNKNIIITGRFSNVNTYYEYKKSIDNKKYIENQCLSCEYYGALNSDFGICGNEKGRLYLETVFEHFGCKEHIYQ